MKFRVAFAWLTLVIFCLVCRIPSQAGMAMPAPGIEAPVEVVQIFNTRPDSADSNDHFPKRADTTAQKDTTKTIVKRNFVHSEQVVIGTTVMIFCIFILVSMANWNPK